MSDPAAEKLNELYQRVKKSEKDTLELQLELGKRLTEEKENHKHGAWKPWVEENCNFSYTQATRYMKLWKELRPKNTVTVFLTEDKAKEVRRKIQGNKPKEEVVSEEIMMKRAANAGEIDLIWEEIRWTVEPVLDSIFDNIAEDDITPAIIAITRYIDEYHTKRIKGED